MSQSQNNLVKMQYDYGINYLVPHFALFATVSVFCQLLSVFRYERLGENNPLSYLLKVYLCFVRDIIQYILELKVTLE